MKRLIYTLFLFCLISCSCALLKKAQGKETVLSGLDILVREDFAPLKGKRVGLVSNHSALDCHGRHILNVMLKSKNVKLQAIFAPEHGFTGIADENVQNAKDEKTGIMIYSLYDKTNRPTPEELKDIDALIFDIQDIGARFYTYISTMAMCMEEAAKNNIEFIVLDRPNPITGLRVDGPIQDRELNRKFTSYFPIPIIHGMTIGELAQMFNDYYGIQCKLTVIRMEGWKRAMFFDETGLSWSNPSPNIRNVTEEILYPAIALTESSESNVSVGRGTQTPFEVVGAPWIDADKLVAEMNSRNLPGVKFTPHHFTPDASKFKGELCHGFKITITDRHAFDTIGTGLHLLSALCKINPTTYKIDPNHGLVGSKDVIERIKKGEPVDKVRESYKKELYEFIKIRNQFIFYKT